MKVAKVDGKHMKDCWFREDDSDPRGWYLDTYSGVQHQSYRGDRYAFLNCNCPECPARLRIRVRDLEDYAVALLAKERAHV